MLVTYWDMQRRAPQLKWFQVRGERFHRRRMSLERAARLTVRWLSVRLAAGRPASLYSHAAKAWEERGLTGFETACVCLAARAIVLKGDLASFPSPLIKR